jgi:hypothetical protein
VDLTAPVRGFGDRDSCNRWLGGEGRKRGGEGSDRPDVGGDEDDEGEGAEPGVSDGGDDVARDGGAGEVAEGDDDHAQCEGQRYKVEHPHLRRLPSAPPYRRPEDEAGVVESVRLRAEASPCRRRGGGGGPREIAVPFCLRRSRGGEAHGGGRKREVLVGRIEQGSFGGVLLFQNIIAGSNHVAFY